MHILLGWTVVPGSPSAGSSVAWRGGGSEGGSCCLGCVLLGAGDAARNVVLSTKPATRFSTDELPLAGVASCLTVTKPPPLLEPPPPLLLPPPNRWFMPGLDCWCCCCWSWPIRLRELALLPLPVHTYHRACTTVKHSCKEFPHTYTLKLHFKGAPDNPILSMLKYTVFYNSAKHFKN